MRQTHTKFVDTCHQGNLAARCQLFLYNFVFFVFCFFVFCCAFACVFVCAVFAFCLICN